MRSTFFRPLKSPFAAITLLLALGWAARERTWASEKAELLKSATITLNQDKMSDHSDRGRIKSATVKLDQVKMGDYSDRGSVVGKLGIYLSGDTPGSSEFVTGRLVLDAGKTPHAPHTHPEEEVMVIEQGHGEIDVDGKITKVGPGSVMYTTPGVSHGIVNTGDTPIVFYFIKWAGKDGK